MRVALLYDAAAHDAAAPDVAAVLPTVEAVDAALRTLGHAPTRIAAGGEPASWLEPLSRSRPDVVFNLCEGYRGDGAGEAAVAAAVELLGVPVTGCRSETLALCRRKDRVNALLDSCGVAVPEWRVAPGIGAWESFPAIVKPLDQDASIGIRQSSVAGEPGELAALIAEATPEAPLLVQRFLNGRELNVGFVGTTALPLAEIRYDAMPAGMWHIVSYEAKWRPGGAEDLGTRPVCPAAVDPAFGERALALASTAWRAVGGRGYGRVDLRADAAGRLHVLEVNPNPDLAPDAGLARMAAAAGWSYDELVARVLAEAR